MKRQKRLTANKIKSASVKYLRFKLNRINIVTEFNSNQLKDREDIAVYYTDDNKNQLDFYEVKISFSDFKHDFIKQKHQKRAFTKFSYIVPPEIAEKCRQYLKENYPDYGLITFDYNNETGEIFNFKTVIKAKKNSYGYHFDERDVYFFKLRMSSMVAQSVEKDEIIEALKEEIAELKADAENAYKSYRDENKDREIESLKKQNLNLANGIEAFRDFLHKKLYLPYYLNDMYKENNLSFKNIETVFKYCLNELDLKYAKQHFSESFKKYSHE